MAISGVIEKYNSYATDKEIDNYVKSLYGEQFEKTNRFIYNGDIEYSQDDRSINYEYSNGETKFTVFSRIELSGDSEFFKNNVYKTCITDNYCDTVFNDNISDVYSILKDTELDYINFHSEYNDYWEDVHSIKINLNYDSDEQIESIVKCLYRIDQLMKFNINKEIDNTQLYDENFVAEPEDYDIVSSGFYIILKINSEVSGEFSEQFYLSANDNCRWTEETIREFIDDSYMYNTITIPMKTPYTYENTLMEV